MLRQLSYVTVLVDDQEQALSFYTETLGLKKRDDRELPNGFRWLSVSPEGQPYPRLAVVPSDREHPEIPTADATLQRERVGSQVGEYVTFVFSVDDCRAATETLRDRGVEIMAGPSQNPWGVESRFRDPWGNVYELVEPRGE